MAMGILYALLFAQQILNHESQLSLPGSRRIPNMARGQLRFCALCRSGVVESCTFPMSRRAGRPPAVEGPGQSQSQLTTFGGEEKKIQDLNDLNLFPVRSQEDQKTFFNACQNVVHSGATNIISIWHHLDPEHTAVLEQLTHPTVAQVIVSERNNIARLNSLNESIRVDLTNLFEANKQAQQFSLQHQHNIIQGLIRDLSLTLQFPELITALKTFLFAMSAAKHEDLTEDQIKERIQQIEAKYQAIKDSNIRKPLQASHKRTVLNQRNQAIHEKSQAEQDINDALIRFLNASQRIQESNHTLQVMQYYLDEKKNEQVQKQIADAYAAYIRAYIIQPDGERGRQKSFEEFQAEFQAKQAQNEDVAVETIVRETQAIDLSKAKSFVGSPDMDQH